MMMKITLVLVMATLARSQRPSFAGMRPIGYPEISTPTTEGLVDKFGEVDATTQRLPVEANGDKDLVDRLSKLPIDKQPFWFINWQALEAHRQKPQTYPQKPNTFVDPINPTQNTNIPSNANPSFNPNGNLFTNNPVAFNSNANFGSTNTNLPNPTSGTVGSGTVNPTPNFGNANTNFAIPTSGTVGSGTVNPTPNFGIANTNLANPTSGTPINANAFSIPISNANTPSLANRISETAANGNAASALEDRFSGGIELNRFPESEIIKSGTVKS